MRKGGGVEKDFVLCARSVGSGGFASEPGPSSYLLVPPGRLPLPSQAVGAAAWARAVRDAAVWGRDSRTGGERGDILFFIHGYNSAQETVMGRHRRIKEDLSGAGFKGIVVSFDWPSSDMALNYLEDRHDAKETALQLVNGGIALLAEMQAPDCSINIHCLAHSTGALVLREACDDADDARLATSGWMMSQVALFGGDISSASLRAGCATTDSLFRHCARLTNYSNGADSVLKLSDAKRMGVAPRVGRVGLPGDAPAKAVNVDCTDYFRQLVSDVEIREADQMAEIGAFDHSWYIGNRLFARDLSETLRGDLEGSAFPTRGIDTLGRLRLVRSESRSYADSLTST